MEVITEEQALKMIHEQDDQGIEKEAAADTPTKCERPED